MLLGFCSLFFLLVLVDLVTVFLMLTSENNCVLKYTPRELIASFRLVGFFTLLGVGKKSVNALCPDEFPNEFPGRVISRL